ncbi:site-specific recombinase XerD [Krasilnikovia cinnamomea]|uniref:Site-specific recombinase XerD n=1 Tax=Krasilnikovia cinnamomea TaxID=349313 RepID=A0A4V2G788_9ACTN|nr:tyrosine-type recombinase/integrase [Krasilnikovia cinnamomea]RZU51596.1 site-specific recombinase XerD [Krasilnikovia cinnamomea]
MTGKRRGHGEGSIYQLPDGRWRGAVDLGWLNGKRRRKYVTRKTRADVAKALLELTALAEAGKLSTERVPTLAQWMEIYLAEVASAKVRPSTLHRYREEVEHHIGPLLGRIRLDKPTPAHITAFYRDRLTVLSAGSVRRLHANLRRALNIAVRWQVIHTNPVSLVDPPPVPHTEVKPYSLAEARAFLKAVQGLRLEARWVLAIALGLRQGEVLGLRWEDVNLDAGTLRVVAQLRRDADTGHLERVETKTARSRRTLPLPESVRAALLRHRERQAAERLDADAWTDPALVFTTRAGTPIHPRNDYRSFRELIRQAGLRQVRIHDLRHTAASVLIAQGVPARVVMEILGHSQISVTLNTYGHVAPEVSREAADRVNAALWGDG